MLLRSLSMGFALGIGFAAALAHGEERRTVAILPVVVHALDEHAYLREGLADMLASRLGQQPGIAVVRIEDPARATLDAESARAAARAVGAQWVLFGSFTRFGDGASLDLTCLPAATPGDAGPRSIFVQAGEIGALIPRLDAVAERVAGHVYGREAGAPGTPPRTELDDLRRRVEALERRAASAPAPAPAPAQP